MRVSAITRPPSLGRQPPARPVPAPRATNGRPSAFASRTQAATSAVERGKATASAVARKMVSPSDS